jgi:hypothetical protein
MPYKDPIKQKEYDKKYRQTSKRIEYMKEYKKTPQHKKTKLLNAWKTRGLIGDYEKIYERYLNTTNCDLCNVELKEGQKGRNRKCMDHCHITNEFRNIVCNTCNQNKSDMKKQSNNKSGYKNIYYNKSNKNWVYEKIFKGKRIKIRRKNKIDILCIKFAAIILYRY